MPKISINDELTIDVDKNFFNLPSEEQNKIVDEAVNQDLLTGTGRAAFSGLMFDFRDEVVAALSAPASAAQYYLGGGEGQDYRKELTRQRALESAFTAENPYLATTAKIAGGLVAPAGVLGQAAKAATVGGKLAKGVLSGTAMGAIGGAGAAEEGQRLGGATLGGAVGGVAAPVAMAAVPVARALGAPVVNTAGRLAGAATKEPSKRAAQMVARRLKDAGVTREALETLKKNPKPTVIADIDGAGIQSLARLVAQSPYKGAELARSLNVRQFGSEAMDSAAERIEKDLLSAGAPAQSARQAKAGLDQIKNTTASELYKEAHSVTVSPTLRASLKPLFNTDAVKRALPLARRIASNEGVDLRGDAIEGIDFAGLDYIQRAMRGQADSFYARGNSELGKSVNEVRKQFLEILKNENPKFKEAFDLYGDVMGKQRALEAGMKFDRLKGEGEISDLLKSMSKEEMHQFRVGVAQSISNKLEASPDARNKASVIANSKLQLRQLKEAFPKENFKALEEALALEKTMAEKRGAILKGSQTFQTSAMEAAEDLTEAQSIARDVRQGGLTGAAAGLSERRLKPALMGVGDQTSEALGKILFETDPARRAAAIEAVQSVGAPSLSQSRRGVMEALGDMTASGVGRVGKSASRGLLFELPTTIAEEQYGILGQ